MLTTQPSLIKRKYLGKGQICTFLFLLCLIPAIFYYRGEWKSDVKRLQTMNVGNILAQLIPEKCEIPQLNLTGLMNKVENTTNQCTNIMLFGGASGSQLKLGDPNYIRQNGAKWVCFDSPSQMQPGKCIIYSFGIKNKWEFDDAMAEFGCQVYAFDPTMGVEDYNRSENIHFYNLGISNITGITTITGKTAKVSRLEDIRKMLGHETTVIDYLKVDVEFMELEMIEDLWTTSPQILTDYVAQIGMEIHYGFNMEMIMRNVQNLVTLLFRLECLGFQSANEEPHDWIIGKSPLNEKPVPCCSEGVWVNKRFI